MCPALYCRHFTYAIYFYYYKKNALQGAHTSFLNFLISNTTYNYFDTSNLNCQVCKLILYSTSQVIIGNSIIRNKALTVRIQLTLWLMSHMTCVDPS